MSSSPPIKPEQLAALPPEFRALLQAVNDHYEARIARLERRIVELESGAKKTPQNSSLPPSSQHPHVKPPPRRPKSKQKRGGQPGHPKHERPLIPSEQCDEVIPLKPTECRRCGERLSGSDSEPWRHQVRDLPVIKPIVTEYQRHRLTCVCGTTTCARLPPGAPSLQAGPQLIALVSLLMGCFRQSKRRVALFLEQVLNQPCSTGWVVKLQYQSTAALRASYDALAAQLPHQAQLGIDETPSKEGSTQGLALDRGRQDVHRLYPAYRP
jgi:transposase